MEDAEEGGAAVSTSTESSNCEEEDPHAEQAEVGVVEQVLSCLTSL